MTTARLAKEMRLTILATTRNFTKRDKLKVTGVDHVIIDDGDIVEQVRELYPDGVDRVLELIGIQTLLNSLKTAKQGGIVDRNFLVLSFFVSMPKLLTRRGNEQIFKPIFTVHKTIQLMRW